MKIITNNSLIFFYLNKINTVVEKITMILKTLLIYLTFTFLQIQHSFGSKLSTCGENCISCLKKKRCLLCLETPLIRNKCERSSSNKISNCRVYQGQGKCYLCSKGYFLDKTKKKCEKKNLIKNCVFGIYDKRLKANRCAICDGGYPDPEKEFRCVSFTGELKSKCLYGEFDSYSRKPICGRCKKDFLLVEDVGCIKKKENTKNGCLIYLSIKTEICLMCDFFQGFVIGENGACVQRKIINIREDHEIEL